MLVSDVGTGLESPRGLPDETIVRAIRVIDRTTPERPPGVSFPRLWRGLPRSASPDAIVTAIVDALRGASGADHVIVARLRPADRVTEAPLVSASPTRTP